MSEQKSSSGQEYALKLDPNMRLEERGEPWTALAVADGGTAALVRVSVVPSGWRVP